MKIVKFRVKVRNDCLLLLPKGKSRYDCSYKSSLLLLCLSSQLTSRLNHTQGENEPKPVSGGVIRGTDLSSLEVLQFV